jgi:hypothetical protein
MASSTQGKPITGKAWEDGSVSLLARVVGQAGTAVTQASLTSITYKIFDTLSDTPTSAVASGTLTISDVIFDTLQTDARWTKDNTGYNFLHTIGAGVLTKENTVYRIEYLFDPVTGENFYVVFEVTTSKIYGS